MGGSPPPPPPPPQQTPANVQTTANVQFSILTANVQTRDFKNNLNKLKAKSRLITSKA